MSLDMEEETIVKRLSLVLALAAALAALAALPARVSATTPAASIPGLKTPGTLTFGTNFGYPPMEMYTGAGVNIPTGADVDLAKEIARRLGLKAAFVNVTNFDTIIPGLQAGRWDVIISSMGVTPERQKVVNFIQYLYAGQSILVRKGNPEHIVGLASLSGKAVAVQSGTTEVNSITAENKTLAKQHKPLITYKTFPEDTTAVQQVAIGRFVADLTDSPIAAYDIKHNQGEFELAGKPFAVAPYGMAFRKADKTLLASVNRAFGAMRKDGAYKKILSTYGLASSGV